MPPDRSISLHLSRFSLWLIAFLIIGPWFAVAGWLLTHRDTGPADAPTVAERSVPTAVNSAPELRGTHSGPWGDLETTRILIEPPEEFILSTYTHPAVQNWVFKGYTEAQLTAVLQSAGLSPGQLAFLSNAANHEIRPGAIVLHPDAPLIEGLSPTARAHLYAALGEFAENTPQYNPYRLRTTIAGDWLDNVDLPANTVALTKKLLYQRGTATCFSDEAIVLPTIPTNAARVRYMKALSRKSALMVYLNVHPGQDVDQLVAYWARGGRTKDLKPLLQSLARLPNGGKIDIVHLLPRFARTLTYTYPLPSENPIDANHDCHWSSFNFQNDSPDERFANIDNVRQALIDQYYPVPGEPLLGDIIMFVRQDGVVLHSCVYIADDIVFTKNGPAFSIPWLLSPLADVQAFYAANPDVEIRRFRAKNL